MPLHLLGKKSWNVYNPASIARVKADEEAAAAREAAADQRTQELDAQRRAAILRGRTPPPLPDEDSVDDGRRRSDRDGGHGRERSDRDGGHDRKRRKRRGEDDTDADIRFAASMTASTNTEDGDAKVLKLRKPASDAPLTDHAGNIDLFPVDVNEAVKREKNAEVEKEKRKKEQAFEDQYTMRFANAAGKNGLDQPWYAAQKKATDDTQAGTAALEYPGFENKDVWGNEDPRRKERQQARISSSDPFAFMQKAQTQLKKSKEDKKKWADERKRELKELRDAQERQDRRSRHHKRSSPDRERRHRHSHRSDRPRSPSRDRDRGRERRDGHSRHSSSTQRRSRSPAGLRPAGRSRRD